MIEVPVELVQELHAHVAKYGKTILQGYGVVSLIQQLPHPKPALERCPACGSEMKIAKVIMPSYAFARCTNVDCQAEGPTNDPDGSKFNAMARPARVLRELMAKLIDDEFDSTDEVIYHLREAQKP